MSKSRVFRDPDPEAVCVSDPDLDAMCFSGSEMLKGRILRDVISAHVRLVHAHPEGHRRHHDSHPANVFFSYIPTVATVDRGRDHRSWSRR